MEIKDEFEADSVSENDFSEEEIHSARVPSKHQSSTKKRKYENITSDKITENGGNSQKRKHKNELYKPPTVEELNNLKETENLYNNNLFRLQIEELVSEINIKNKRKKNLSVWLESFQRLLSNFPENEDTILLSNIQKVAKKKSTRGHKLVNKLADIEIDLDTDQDIMLKFPKPESIEMFGLFENSCLAGPNVLLNINLKIPKTCFLVKDFLNNRYFCKRYYYLLHIAERLKSSEIIADVSVGYHEGNFLLPVLNVEPTGCDKILVVIYASPSEDYFKPTRCLPEQNNVKQDLFNTNLDNEVLKSMPTTLYNSSLGHDITLSINSDFIKETLKEQSNVQEGIKLLCVWLKQRELHVGLGAFSENLIVYFVVYLLSKKKINKFMSSYQVIRNFWNFIASSDLQEDPISIADVSKDILDSFKKHFAVVCLDKSGCYNVAAFLNVEVYKKVKTECQAAVKHLDDSKNNSFQHLFLTTLPFYLQYDLVIDLTKSLPLENKFDIREEEKAKFIGYNDLLIVTYISKIIRRGLNRRVLNFVPRLETEGKKLKRLLFGINLNPDEAFNFIELGPALNDHTAATDFRTFWGSLSSDRRFRDGSTHVAVYFRTNTIKGKRNIIKKILNFVIEEKLGLQFKLYYDEFEEVLLSKKLVPSYPSGTNEETSLKIIKASDELGKKIRALQMSLNVTGVQGVSDVYSFTEVFPPVPSNYQVGHRATTIKGNNLIFSNKKPGSCPRYIQPIECVLQLEHSSKWPSDLEALRHIKTSFYLEISKVLQTNHKILSNVTPDFIDVFFEGLVFRYRLHVPKEIVLVKRKATETGVICYRESLESFHMENSLVVLPKVVGALKGVQSLYPSYGPGTALIKRWLRSQLIDGFYFPDIVIDLLNASLYINNVYAPSNTPQISFLKFLKFFSEFDWNLQTISVNFNDDITNEEISELESKLQKNREGFPPLFIIMPFDQGLSVFTKYAPTKEVLNRVRQLAMESLNFVNNIIIEQNCVGIKELFIPNFDGYNVLIHLNPPLNPRRHERILFKSPENRTVVEKYKVDDDDKLPIVDFNPVEKYLTTLRDNYGKYAMFFHDTFGGNTIGVLWHPKVFEPVDFKVSQVNAGIVVDGKVVFNMDAVIEDFYIVGKDLVKTIEKR